jgi:hypothetical protein
MTCLTKNIDTEWFQLMEVKCGPVVYGKLNWKKNKNQKKEPPRVK